MPAAELTRLRMQINGLIQLFGEPNNFRTSLRDMFEAYANLTYRPGQTVLQKSLLPSYRAPKLVMRQLELELGKTCRERPEDALEVIEVLWYDPYLEPRQLAAVILGKIPASHSQEVAQKIKTWSRPEENSRMLDTLFQHGTITLRQTAPKQLLALIEELLNSTHGATQAIGIRAIVPLMQDPEFENLPPIFRMLGPLLQSFSTALQTDLQIAIESLARRSPMETAFFLRQTLNITSSPATSRLIRRCLPAFEPAQQSSLRAAIQAATQE